MQTLTEIVQEVLERWILASRGESHDMFDLADEVSQQFEESNIPMIYNAAIDALGILFHSGEVVSNSKRFIDKLEALTVDRLRILVSSPIEINIEEARFAQKALGL
ncbi:hypothetical protein Q0812_10715 [Brevundimonas sp. 2R-24]|uniref:Uncharacterized protein n=1 Tax=Peiella sedimenti TaxID=3061083 RepID=A0ABT8SP52_9CAUL|nr:hypothetical protein [Caulobacteraceae bacterium XZ-24]